MTSLCDDFRFDRIEGTWGDLRGSLEVHDPGQLRVYDQVDQVDLIIS